MHLLIFFLILKCNAKIQEQPISLDVHVNGHGRPLLDHVVESSPVDKLEEITSNLNSDMLNNPYYKLPQLDRTIRQLALLHPELMSKLGVYVLPARKSTVSSVEDLEPLEHEDTEQKKDEQLEANYEHFIKQTEMIKVMTPEEKMMYIPKLKEAIVYEILKQRQTLESLTEKLAAESQ